MKTTRRVNRNQSPEHVDILERLKAYRFVAAILAMAVVVSGIAQFTGSLATIDNDISNFYKQLKRPAILSATAEKSAVGDQELAQYGEGHFYSADQDDFVVSMHLRLRFRTDNYNHEVFLNSVSNIGFKNSDGQELSADELNKGEATDEGFNATFALSFKLQPKASDTITLRAATFSTQFILGRLIWAKYPISKDEPSKGYWQGAQAQLSILLPDPNWPILRSARLIKGDHPLLELVIDNRSPHQIPLTNVIILASKSRDLGVDCLNGDQPQQVVLSWPQTIERGRENGSWTKVADQVVKVPTTYNYIGRCSNYGFRASIPVIDTLSSGAVNRLLFSIDELPVDELPERTGRMPSFLHPSIPEGEGMAVMDWPILKAAVEPADEVFPSELR